MPKTPPLNPTVKFATLQDGDTPLKLVFTFNALATAESLSSQNLLKSLDMNNMSISSIRALLYATLLHFQPKISLEKAGDLLQRVGVAAAVQAVISAWSASQPDDPNAEPDESEIDPAI